MEWVCSFSAPLEEDGRGLFVTLPPEAVQLLGRGPAAVFADGLRCPGGLSPAGRLVFRSRMRLRLGKRAGEVVTVTLRIKEAPGRWE